MYERNNVIRQFEETIAKYCGAKYAVAVESCSSALFLCCLHLKVEEVTLPKRTYFSVPAGVIHAGGKVKFEEFEWQGAYQLHPYPIIDSAMRLKKNMYRPGFYHCLSFHAAKHIPIERGGMILTDNEESRDWFRVMRNDGRREVPKEQDRVSELGWNFYMTPAQAGRGLDLFNWITKGGSVDMEDLPNTHMDISYVQSLQ